MTQIQDVGDEDLAEEREILEFAVPSSDSRRERKTHSACDQSQSCRVSTSIAYVIPHFYRDYIRLNNISRLCSPPLQL